MRQATRPAGEIMSELIRLANVTMHDQTEYLEAFRALGYEVDPRPLLRVCAGADDAAIAACEAIEAAEAQGAEGVLLGGRTDMCIYAALIAASADLGLFIAETARLRDADGNFQFNLVGVTPIDLGKYGLGVGQAEYCPAYPYVLYATGRECPWPLGDVYVTSPEERRLGYPERLRVNGARCFYVQPGTSEDMQVHMALCQEEGAQWPPPLSPVRRVTQGIRAALDPSLRLRAVNNRGIRALFRPEGDSATYEATIRGIELDLGWEDEEGAGGVTGWWLGYSYPGGREDGMFVNGDIDGPDWADVADVVTKVAEL